ncbi:DUF6502 family protein [Thiomicrorhabdus heinhorstiae]|uniref:Uncharacterized protein n=1 Tax=Thiomicrorhabdus heinhorstiae TaxID=2748010 RepID=A0ABS0BWQ6_9GAMM|nr:DUF6502 family protein [Thiomicrorhabdus heinhorstiae]MBF6058242.1 hypothetical protein [Thiomicrorhabdus heinhorstiae]
MSENTSDIQNSLAKAVRAMLLPLVKLLLHKGIGYPALTELLKQLYVEVAEKDFKLENKRLTDSRISLLTGVHRKEVKRLRESVEESATQPEIRAGISAEMMALWFGDPIYLNDDHTPKALPKNGPEPSFESLVYSVSKDKHPRSILDDWLNQEMVFVDSEDFVHLNSAGFVPRHDEAEKLFFAGKNIGAHLNVVAHNLKAVSDPQFERAVYYHQLSQQSVETLEILAKQKSMQLLSEINQEARQLQNSEEETETNSGFHLGIYFEKNSAQEENK